LALVLSANVAVTFEEGQEALSGELGRHDLNLLQLEVTHFELGIFSARVKQ
jgi:hypothetical protein